MKSQGRGPAAETEKEEQDMKRLVAVTSTLALGLVALTGCSEQLGDRNGVDGAPPDQILDVDYVEVYRNADGFPNISRACVQGLGFATSSTGRGESAGGAMIARVPEWDAFCATHATPTDGAPASEDQPPTAPDVQTPAGTP